MLQFDRKSLGGVWMSAILTRFNHLLGEIEGLYHDISLKLGISDSSSKILYTLCVFDHRCSLRRLCRQNGLSKQTVNSALRQLEKQGLVMLEPSGGKQKDVLLTEAGIIYAEAMVSKIIAMENEIFAAWNPEDVERYLVLTEQYLLALEEKAHQL